MFGKRGLMIALVVGLLCVGFASHAVACQWCIYKSANYSEVTLAREQQLLVTYTIRLEGECDYNLIVKAYDTNSLPADGTCSGLPAGFLEAFNCGSSIDPATVFEKTYTKYIGGFSVCGDYVVENTACLPDWLEPCGTASWTITVHVPCDGGCTLTPGYWKTHSKYGPAPYDDAWALLMPSGEDSQFFTSGKSWYQVLWTPPRGNAYYILAFQYIAAKLNVLNGADGSAINSALAWAESFFGTHAPSSLLSKSERNQVLSYANILDQYNNGYIGPGHCTE